MAQDSWSMYEHDKVIIFKHLDFSDAVDRLIDRVETLMERNTYLEEILVKYEKLIGVPEHMALINKLISDKKG